MGVMISCPSCSARLKVNDRLMGRKVRCPKCSATVPVARAPVDDDQDIRDEEAFEDRPRRKKKNTTNTGPIVAMIIAGLLVVVAGTVLIGIPLLGKRQPAPDLLDPPGGPPFAGGPAAKDVALRDATFAQVSQAIQAHKGKVVVLKIWGFF